MSFDASTIQAIRRVAKENGWPEAALLAVVEVESNGQVYARVNGRHEPLIRFEGHYFYKRLDGSDLRKAVEEGLANREAGKVKNPSSQVARWAMLDRAARINKKAAYESTSWGVGQVMGAHWNWLGYRSIDAFVEEVRSGVRGQVRVMARYIEKAGLAEALKNQDWRTFAKGYNGPAYAKNRYHIKMAEAFAQWNGSIGTQPELQEESSVTELQRLLHMNGFDISIDGMMGPQTREAIRQFQLNSGLVVDGIAGPKTMAELRKKAAESTAPQKEQNFVATLIKALVAFISGLFGKK